MSKLNSNLSCISTTLCLVGAVALNQASADCTADETAPELKLTAPSCGGPSDCQGNVDLGATTEPVISLSGNANESNGLSYIKWLLGSDSGYANAFTEWDGTYYWTIDGIGLEEGDNTIVIEARDAAGNEANMNVAVSYEPPPPPPPPVDGVNDIIDDKAKITFYDYPGEDRFNLVAYMTVPNNDFTYPCEQDVIISASVVAPDDQSSELLLFTDTIPAGSASTCSSSKYRVVLPGPDLREVVFQLQNPSSVYLYVYARKGTYFPELLASMSEEEYLNYVKDIEKFKVTVQFGDGRSWSGWSDGLGAVTPWEKQAPCEHLNETVYSSKVELRCNR
jgi:hypothetical protein